VVWSEIALLIGRSLSGDARKPTTPGTAVNDSTALEPITDNAERVFSHGTDFVSYNEEDLMSISTEAEAKKCLGKRGQ